MRHPRWLSVFGRLCLAGGAVLAVTGCSGEALNSRNKFDEHPLAKAGQKKIIEDERERGIWHSERGADESAVSVGSGSEGGGLFGGGSGKKSQDQLRADKLFAGALDAVLELPVITASREGGFIATDWKTDPRDPSARYRLNIRVSGKAPYGDVKVKVLKQTQDPGGAWLDRPADEGMAADIQKAIRKHAENVKK
jgi:hypothetical protein